MRVNLLEPALFMYHLVAFCCSPIDKQRFEQEYRKRCSRLSEHRGVRHRRDSTQDNDDDVDDDDDDPDDPDETDWSVLLRPLELIALIKRYHMAGNWFILFALLHILLLVHFTIKCVVHTFITGQDQHKMDYFNSVYYTHMLGFLPQPHRSNRLALVLCLYCLSIRLSCAYRLVRDSIVNANRYKEARITPLNLSGLTATRFTRDEWRAFFKQSYEGNDPDYLKLSPLVELNMSKFSRFELTYHVNAIDFNDIFKKIVGPVADRDNRKPSHRRWHCTRPYYRMEPRGLLIGLVVCCLGFVIAIVIGVACGCWVFYSELRSSFPFDYQPTWGEVLARWSHHLTSPFHLIRICELNLLVFFFACIQVDAALVFTDARILLDRQEKLRRLMKRVLELCRRDNSSGDGWHSRPLTAAEPQLAASSPGDSSFHYHHHSHNHLRVTPRNYNDKQVVQDAESRSRELGRQIEHKVQLSDCLRREFSDLKKMHTFLVHIIIFGSGLSISYNISLLATMQDNSEVVILILALIGSVIPLTTALLLCALLERGFRDIYQVMNLLLENKNNILGPGTIRIIMKGSKSFERETDRAFRIVGLYSITLGSIAPFFAYMATAILYLIRFSG